MQSLNTGNSRCSCISLTGTIARRHVILPKALAKYVPCERLMEEDEWRGIGVTQSPGWEHYLIHAPEPHILLFKREKDYQLKYPQ